MNFKRAGARNATAGPKSPALSLFGRICPPTASFPSVWQRGKVVADETQVSVNTDVRTAEYFANRGEVGKEGNNLQATPAI